MKNRSKKKHKHTKGEESMKSNINILFITRHFPPNKGGMERVSFEFYKWLSEKYNLGRVYLVKINLDRKLFSLAFLILLIRSLRILSRNKICIVYLQDGSLAPLGFLFKKLFKRKVLITIHGLDITYRNIIYQAVIPKLVSKLDKVVCISNATKKQCIIRGIPEEKVEVIPNGISDTFYLKNLNREKGRFLIHKILGIDKSKKIILSVGRLVERKGFHLFIEHVIPRLASKRSDFVYIIVGSGALKKQIQNIIMKKKLRERVILLGQVTDNFLKLLYNTSDIFVAPNIPVKGDMEGLGMVILEAATCGLPIVASSIDGIGDIVNKSNTSLGIALQPFDWEGYENTINKLLDDNKLRAYLGNRARKIALKLYSWDKVGKRYMTLFLKLLD